MDSMNFVFLPETSDLISTALAGVVCYFTKQLPPVTAAIEQLGSIMVAKNIANNTAFADSLGGEMIQEYDIFTAAAQGSYSALKKRSVNMIAMNSVKGAVYNVAGRMAAEQLAAFRN